MRKKHSPGCSVRDCCGSCTNGAHALFSDDFSGDLSAWTSTQNASINGSDELVLTPTGQGGIPSASVSLNYIGCPKTTNLIYSASVDRYLGDRFVESNNFYTVFAESYLQLSISNQFTIRFIHQNADESDPVDPGEYVGWVSADGPLSTTVLSNTPADGDKITIRIVAGSPNWTAEFLVNDVLSTSISFQLDNAPLTTQCECNLFIYCELIHNPSTVVTTGAKFDDVLASADCS